jgi:hypothetical protein
MNVLVLIASRTIASQAESSVVIGGHQNDETVLQQW